MHIHATQANAAGNALAGAQAAETAMSLRRARELRDAAAKLKGASFDFGSGIPQDTLSDVQSDAQAVSLVSAWAGGSSASGQSALAIQDSISQRSAADSELPNLPVQVQEVQRTSSSAPVSYWA
jgi:hypothetical protein